MRWHVRKSRSKKKKNNKKLTKTKTCYVHSKTALLSINLMDWMRSHLQSIQREKKREKTKENSDIKFIPSKLRNFGAQKKKKKTTWTNYTRNIFVYILSLFRHSLSTSKISESHYSSRELLQWKMFHKQNEKHLQFEHFCQKEYKWTKKKISKQRRQSERERERHDDTMHA